RLPAEPFSLYAANIRKIFPIPPINIVKGVVLKCLVARDLARRGSMSARLEKKVFLGVMLSGCFEPGKMKALLPGALRLAREKGIGLEILAHPGAVYEPEDIARITNADDRAFLTSLNREREAESFMKMRR
ncbi:MAG: hypothetical protein Q4G47_00015, partial [Lachnospiraceae bacterium]|nr:hypothetical protein [Lachnospiraceae bacterium]